jgi:hypothetical protein
MQREHRSDKCGGPQCTGHSSQQQEHQHRVGRVKEQVREMVAHRFKPENLEVEHVRNPGERMPVARMPGGECPFQGFEIDAVLDVLVLGDVTARARPKQISAVKFFGFDSAMNYPFCRETRLEETNF